MFCRRMTASVTIHALRLYLPLGMLVFITVRMLLFRSRVWRLFSSQPIDLGALEPIWRKLELINQECRTHVFGAKRIASVSLAGRTIQLIYGVVSVNAPRGSSGSSHVYAIGEGDDADWMRHFPDVFDLAFAGSAGSVFWVRLPTLMRLTKRCSQTLARHGQDFDDSNLLPPPRAPSPAVSDLVR